MIDNGTMDRNIKYLMISLLSALLVFSACRTKRTVMKAPIKEEGVAFLQEEMDKNELKFEYFTAKFELEFIKDKQKQDLKGQIRIKKDSIIWLSLSPALGIEIARLVATQDSVILMNRLNKTYFKGDYNVINQLFETKIDYDILQALMVGNDLTQYEDHTFKADIDGNEYRLSTSKRRKLKNFVKSSDDDLKVFIMSIWLHPEIFKIVRMNIKEIQKENKKLTVQYHDFQLLDGQYIPRQLQFDLDAETPISLNVQYKKLELNEEKSYNLSIPPHYQPIQ